MLTQFVNSTKEEECLPLVATKTPLWQAMTPNTLEFKQIPLSETRIAVSEKLIEEEFPVKLEAADGMTDLPNESSFAPIMNRNSFDSLSQETFWGSDSKNFESRDFFTVEQVVSDRESDTLSRVIFLENN